MITKFKFFESIRDEYPGLFEPEKEEDKPQVVPGFETGTIDPEDTESWEFNGVHYEPESEQYKKFIKITKERNFTETDTEIKINVKRLYHDFYMSIYNPIKHFKIFITDELIGKYIKYGYKDYDDNRYEGIITNIKFIFDNYSVFLEFDLKGVKLPLYTYCEPIIIIDKLKSDTNKYNL